MTELLSYIVSGLAVGSVYGLVALGFVLVFKAAGAINFAHGEFLMVAAYLTLTTAVTHNYPLMVSFVVVAAALGVIGALVYYLVGRPLVGAPVFTLILVTIGLAQVMRAALLIAYGPLERQSVAVLPSGGFYIGDVRVSWIDVISFGVGMTFTFLFFVFFRRTTLGLQMRSVAENLQASLVVGLRPGRMFMLAWVIAGLAAGVAGFLYSNRTPVISLGLSSIGLRAFPAAMLGGIRSVEGAVLGGLIVGVLEQMAAGYLGSEWRDAAAFSVMFAVLLVRPTGLFGHPETIRV